MKTITAHWKRHRLCLVFFVARWSFCTVCGKKQFHFVYASHTLYVERRLLLFPQSRLQFTTNRYLFGMFYRPAGSYRWMNLNRVRANQIHRIWLSSFMNSFSFAFFPSQLFSKTTTTKIMLFSIYWDVRHHWFGIFSKNLNKRKQIFISNRQRVR